MPNLICNCCGKEYYVPKYREHISKFCSRECQNHSQYEFVAKVCLCCNKEFKVSNSRANKKFCSKECTIFTKTTQKDRRRQSQRLTTVKRGTATSKTLRKFVFSIKEKKCEICGYDEYDFCLDIHHIDNNPINNDITNLAVLCCICHKKLHKNVIKYSGKYGGDDIER